MSWIIRRLAQSGLALLAVMLLLPALAAGAPVLPVVVKARLPHDPGAFTQGLLYRNGVFYESTGLYGRSSLRRVDPATGRVLARRELPREVFGEGLTLVDGSLYQLTWREGRVLLADPSDLSPRGELALPTEGWGACALGARLVVSDGSDKLFFYDPKTMAGRIWANVWGDTRIAVIDPATGRIAAWADCSGLRPGAVAVDFENVLNGIAHDPATGRVWVTGKRWPEMYEIAVPGLPTGGTPLSGPGHGGATP
jgi:glutamine cyclotransferase